MANDQTVDDDVLYSVVAEIRTWASGEVTVPETLEEKED